MTSRIGLGTLLALVVAAGLGADGSAAALEAEPRTTAATAPVRTLAALTSPVASFAQAGDRIAWIGCDRRLRVRSLRTARDTLVTRRAGDGCSDPAGYARGEQQPLAFDGGRLLWARRSGSSGGLYHDFVTAGRAGGAPRIVGRAAEHVEHRAQAAAFDPNRAVLAGGRGGLLFYTFCDYDCGGGPGSSGGVRRVRGAASVALAAGPEETRLIDLDASGPRYATLHNEIRSCGCDEEPSWSPDGSRIAFSSRSSRTEQQADLFVVDARGGAPRRLTSTPDHESHPAWSPDGRRIAATAGGRIHLYDSVSGERAEVTRGYAPSWSSDGGRIAFARAAGTTSTEIRTVDAASGGDGVLVASVPLTPPVRVTHVAWSPDGREIAVSFFSDVRGVEILSVATGTRRTLRVASDRVSWSQDSRRLLVAPLSAFDDPDTRALAVIEADGTGLRRLTDGTYADRGAQWSPDGSRIAFTSDRAFPGRNVELYVADADARRPRALTPPRLAAVTEVRRLSDGRLVARVERPGVASSVALSERVGALVIRRGGVRRLELFDSLTGRSLGAVRTPPGFVPDPKATGDTIVYRVGTTIWALDARTKRSRVVARAGSRPIGLSVDGRRVAWAENRGGRAYVRAVELAP
jgi:Tol biopolymer transport system component